MERTFHAIKKKYLQLQSRKTFSNIACCSCICSDPAHASKELTSEGDQKHSAWKYTRIKGGVRAGQMVTSMSKAKKIIVKLHLRT